MGIVGAPAAAGGALLAPAVRLGDHLHRTPHQRPHVRGDHAVGARHEHHFVLSPQARHHLHHARIETAAHLLQPLEQLDLLHVGQRVERVLGPVEVPAGSASREG